MRTGGICAAAFPFRRGPALPVLAETLKPEEGQALSEIDKQTLQDCGFGFDELLVRNQNDRMIPRYQRKTRSVTSRC